MTLAGYAVLVGVPVTSSAWVNLLGLKWKLAGLQALTWEVCLLEQLLPL